MIIPSPLRSIALAVGLVSSFASAGRTRASSEILACEDCTTCVTDSSETDNTSSWIFRRSTYSHDPYTGARVAQYLRTPPVEPLDDTRLVTSRYRRSRTNLRGTGGSIDTYYEVQAWGNGRGGIDAEWERFHDAWKESVLSGGFYNQGPVYAPGGYGGYPNYGYGPGYGEGFPGGVYPGGAFPGYGGPGFGQPPRRDWNQRYRDDEAPHAAGGHQGDGPQGGPDGDRGRSDRSL